MKVGYTGHNLGSEQISRPDAKNPANARNAGRTAGLDSVSSEDTKEANAMKKARVPSGAVNAEISPKAREFAHAKALASSAPDVREEKIAELKQRIAAGQYRINANAIADKLVDEHIETADLG